MNRNFIYIGLLLTGLIFAASTATVLAKHFNPSASHKEQSMTHPHVALHTNYGDIVLELDNEKAPKSTANFLEYVRSGHYNGTIFHRVINGFMIQGGGFDSNMTQKPTNDPIPNEADNGLKNLAGTIAMARTNDPDSASAQFFINVVDNDFLNHTGKTPQGWGYAVFGKVIQGMDVVDKIKAVETGNRGFHQNVPVDPVVINSADIIQQ